MFTIGEVIICVDEHLYKLSEEFVMSHSMITYEKRYNVLGLSYDCKNVYIYNDINTIVLCDGNLFVTVNQYRMAKLQKIKKIILKRKLQWWQLAK